MIKYLLLLVAICAITSCTNSCPSFYTEDLLQSGKSIIMKGTIGGSLEYEYSAPVSFPIPTSGIEVAVTTATIGDYNPLPSYGYNYYLEAQRKPNSNSVNYKLIMDNDNSWTTMQLSYLVCARNDMAVGNFETPSTEWLSAGSSVYSVNYRLNKNLPKVDYKVAAFVSGFSTTDHEFSLTLSKKQFDAEQKNIIVYFYCSANPVVLTLSISFIVYPENHQVLDFFYELEPKGETGAYQISGPVDFQPNKLIEYNEWRVGNRHFACTGNQCSGPCIRREECVGNNGNAWQDQCIYCAPGVVFEYGLCTKKCGANQIYLNRVCVCSNGFVRKGKDCVREKECGPNQQWSNKEGKCMCRKQFSRFYEDCRQCPLQSDVSNDGSSCICRYNSKIYDSKTNICKDRCQGNQIWNNKTCECPNKYIWWSQKCRACPDNSDASANQSTCVCRSKTAYFSPEKNSCIECRVNYILIKNKCICRSGFTEVNSQCVAVVKCNENEELNSVTKKCQCRPEFAKDKQGACKPRCSTNEQWTAKGCVCISGYAKYGSCRKCPPGTKTNGVQCSCINQDHIFSLTKFDCIPCQSNSSPNKDGSACACDSGFTANKDGSCIRNCKQFQVFNAKTGGCDCKSGYTRSLKGGPCTSSCSAGQEWDGKTCICLKNFAKYGTCKKCPQGSTPNAQRTACICSGNSIFSSEKFDCLACPANSKPKNDLSECVCNSGFKKSGAVCVASCGKNEELNTKSNKCECIADYYKAGGKECVPRCKQNEQYNGLKCICKTGYGLFKNVCTKCPADGAGSVSRTRCTCTVPNYKFNTETFKCQACPANSRNSEDDTTCVCNTGYKQEGRNCNPVCDFGQQVNPKTGACECRADFIQLGPTCVERCGLNEEWNGSICLCKQKHVRSVGVCRPCPNSLLTNPKRTACLCNNSEEYFSTTQFACLALPSNSSPNNDFSDFVCLPGYRKDNANCIANCPVGAAPDTKGNCVCGGGYVLQGSSCVKPISCPVRSVWDTKLLQCVCTTKGENLLNGECKTCDQNSFFSATANKCQCSTGFFLVGGVCTACDARTKYNGTDCVCNLGYFGTKDKCEKCHSSCSTCSGPEANQCLSCSDVSLIFQKGYCSKNSPCDPGFFKGEQYCEKCGGNCIICRNIFDCTQCAVGYRSISVQISGQKIQTCSEVCGDGIKYQSECDDGNTDNNDGCSRNCTVQVGWSCSGGSSSKKSICNKFIPDQSILTSRGAVNLGGSVVQAIRVSYLPTCLTQNECSKCFKLLECKVVDANVPVLVKVNFIPFSQYQFLVQYDFQGLIVTSKFNTVIRFNEQFKGCLNDDDFAQQLQLEIDPAFLAKVDQQETLTLDQIADPNKIVVPPSANQILMGSP